METTHIQKGLLLLPGGMQEDELPKDDNEDGELLRMAVAMSLRTESGLILQKEKNKLNDSRAIFRWRTGREPGSG